MFSLPLPLPLSCATLLLSSTQSTSHPYPLVFSKYTHSYKLLHDTWYLKIVAEEKNRIRCRDVLRWGRNAPTGSRKAKGRAGGAVYSSATSLETLVRSFCSNRFCFCWVYVFVPIIIALFNMKGTRVWMWNVLAGSGCWVCIRCCSVYKHMVLVFSSNNTQKNNGCQIMVQVDQCLSCRQFVLSQQFFPKLCRWDFYILPIRSGSRKWCVSSGLGSAARRFYPSYLIEPAELVIQIGFLI